MIAVNDNRVRLGLLFTFILVSSFLLGQSSRLNFDQISVEDGLSQATVKDVIKDHQGLIWITTDEGLNRYDGYRFKVYRPTEDAFSLSSNYTDKLYLDRQNNLWIATSNGVCRYNREKDNFQRYYGETDGSRSTNLEVSDIIEDENGTLWISTQDKTHYLLRYDEKEDQFIPCLDKTIREPLSRIIPFDENHLLISFLSKSLYLFNTSSYEYKKLPQTLPEEALKLVRDQNNTIWIGTDNEGLYALRNIEEELVSFTHDPSDPNSISSNVIWDIELRSNGDLWLATDKGLNLFDPESFRAQSYQYDPNNPRSIASNFIYSIYEEDDGRIWAGTSEAGISLMHPSSKTFEHFHNQLGLGKSLSSSVIWAIERDSSGQVWIGTSEGLNKIDLSDHSIEGIFHKPGDSKSLSHNRVWAIQNDPFEDCIWLGTSLGLNKMEWTEDGEYEFSSWQLDETDPQSLSSNSIRCLLVEKDGIWAGTSVDGLNFFNRNTNRVTRYQHREEDPTTLSGNRIRSIFKDSKRRLWIGTRNGLNLLENGQFKRFYYQPEDPNTLSNNHIRVIREGANNTYWIGTDYGLNKMVYSDDGAVTFTRYTTEDGLPNNRIYGIELEKEQLWLSTNNGIAKFDPETGRCINFFDVDGLQSNEFNQGASKRDEEGYVYFGGINGLTRFLPQNVAAQDVRQDIVFTKFKVHFEDVEISEDGPLRANIITSPDIVLNPDERVFSIEFNALNFNKQVKNRYAYRLMPFEKKWNFADQLNQAVYTNVPPGKYRFEVKTSTYGESDPDDVAHLNIHVKHGYWETWWFKISALLGLIGVGYFIYQYRLRSLLRSQEILENKVNERTVVIEQQKKSLETTLSKLKSTQDQLVEQEKMATIGQLTAGIAHEINNPINFIATSTEALAMDMNDLRKIIGAILSLEETDDSSKIKQLIKLRNEVDVAYLNDEIDTLIKSIKNGTQRTSKIIKSLGYLSYKNKPKKELLDIHDPINSAIYILHSKLENRISLSREFAQLPKIMGFPGELNQVFINIISNSIQAIPKEGNISIKTALEAENHIKIIIADTGEGMSEAVQKQIFEPFFTTKEVGQGTGLGLSISYGIVEGHEGKISVDSQEGEGTQFTIILPVK